MPPRLILWDMGDNELEPDDDERMKVMGGMRSTQDWWIPQSAYNATTTMSLNYNAWQKRWDWDWSTSEFSYPSANGVWGQAAARQQLNRTNSFVLRPSKLKVACSCVFN